MKKRQVTFAKIEREREVRERRARKLEKKHAAAAARKATADGENSERDQGAKVEYEVEEGPKGPQAQSVNVVP